MPIRGHAHPVRDFGGDAAGHVTLVDRDPLPAVLTTSTDSPREQLVAGRALQHVLLRAHCAGIAVSHLATAVEAPAVRAALSRLVGAVPHAVLRLGFAAPPTPSAPTPRRPLAQAVTYAAAVRAR
ncbi:hypothetical protein L6E12_07110 [Actinokineospora sp. PR83]|uniref:hypothetical protein n=1 Tax=Actinokineospora sp. PR83 TaxID=2884908 RepID=UPI001F27B986|nr:hypothetical protein [Actinokineospora sp. PR83]MCG8915551.1 hypothetical protein [Actinokineospora sp. PR83]